MDHPFSAIKHNNRAVRPRYHEMLKDFRAAVSSQFDFQGPQWVAAGYSWQCAVV